MPFSRVPTLQVGSRYHLRGRRQDTVKVLVSYAHLIADFCYFFSSVGNWGTTKLRKNKVLFIIFSPEKNLRIILKCHFLSVSHISASQGLSGTQTQEIKRKSEEKKKKKVEDWKIKPRKTLNPFELNQIKLQVCLSSPLTKSLSFWHIHLSPLFLRLFHCFYLFIRKTRGNSHLHPYSGISGGLLVEFC